MITIVDLAIPALHLINSALFTVNLLAVWAVLSYCISMISLSHMVINGLLIMFIIETAMPAPVIFAGITLQMIASFTNIVHVFFFTHFFTVEIWAMSKFLRIL